MRFNFKKEKKDLKRDCMVCNDEDWGLASSQIIANIKKAMKQQGIRLKDMADALDISQARVSQILNKKSNLTLKTICAIERVLHVKVFDIPVYDGIDSQKEWRRYKDEQERILNEE